MSDTALSSPESAPIPATRPLSQRLVVEVTRCLFLWQRSVRRQLLSRQTLVAVLLVGLCALIVLAWSQQRQPTTKKFAEFVLIPVYLGFLIPIFAICYGASSIGGEREDGTLIYLLIASMPRPLIYTMKFLASLFLATVVAALSLGLLCLLGGISGWEAWPIFWPASLLGVMSYSALFLLLGTVFRHGTVIALSYWFFLEVLLGNLPGMINRVSLAFYLRCLIYERGQPYRIQPLGDALTNQFRPIPGPSAATVLVILLALMYLCGLVVFSRKEYRDVS